MSTPSILRNFESETIGNTPSFMTRTAYGDTENCVVASGGPSGFTKVLKATAASGLGLSTYFVDNVADPANTNYCNAVFLFKLGSDSRLIVGNQISLTCVYSAYMKNDGTDALSTRYYNGSTATQIGSWKYKTISSSTWYYCRFLQNGTTVSVRIWAMGDSEPETWDSSGAWGGTPLTGYPQPLIMLRPDTSTYYSWEIAGYVASFDSGVDPGLPLSSFPAGGNTDFGDFTLEGYGNFHGAVTGPEFELDGYGNFCGEVEHSYFEMDGYGNSTGLVTFPDAVLAGESFFGGIGNIDFPEFGIHQAISGNGEIHEDTRDLFDYTGRSGALGSVSFSMGLRATGSQLVSGNAETSFGTFTLDGDGNFAGAVSFEDAAINASGSSLPVGRAGIDWSLSVGGAGKVGTVEAGSSPVEFPAFQISGAGTVRVVGHAAMDFERFRADGVALPGCSGDGVIVLPSPVVLASGQHLPRGEGAIEFSIDLPSSGCHGYNDRYQHPILRFERHP